MPYDMKQKSVFQYLDRYFKKEILGTLNPLYGSSTPLKTRCSAQLTLLVRYMYIKEAKFAHPYMYNIYS